MVRLLASEFMQRLPKHHPFLLCSVMIYHSFTLRLSRALASTLLWFSLGVWAAEPSATCPPPCGPLRLPEQNAVQPTLPAKPTVAPTTSLEDSWLREWSWGVYGGKYYDTEPGGFIAGRAAYLEQYLLAFTAKKTIWQSASLPLALELHGVVGIQGGIATLGEVAVAPALRWSGFPWQNYVHTSFTAAPLGISYTPHVSPLERGKDGRGSQFLNFLFLEIAVASPKDKSSEVFARLHHRSTINNLLNDYGANGEDFLTFGFRRRF